MPKKKQNASKQSQRPRDTKGRFISRSASISEQPPSSPERQQSLAAELALADQPRSPSLPRDQSAPLLPETPRERQSQQTPELLPAPQPVSYHRNPLLQFDPEGAPSTNLYTGSAHPPRFQNPALPYAWHPDPRQQGSPQSQVPPRSSEHLQVPEDNPPNPETWREPRVLSLTSSSLSEPQSLADSLPSAHLNRSSGPPSLGDLPLTSTYSHRSKPRSVEMDMGEGPSAPRANPRFDLRQDARMESDMHHASQSVPPELSNGKGKKPLPRFPYTLSEYQRDAAIILLLNDEMGLGEYPELLEVVDPRDCMTARQVLADYPQDKMKFLHQAHDNIQRVTANPTKFRMFMDRFLLGPSTMSPVRPSPDRRSHANSVHRHSPYGGSPQRSPRRPVSRRLMDRPPPTFNIYDDPRTHQPPAPQARLASMAPPPSNRNRSSYGREPTFAREPEPRHRSTHHYADYREDVLAQDHMAHPSPHRPHVYDQPRREQSHRPQSDPSTSRRTQVKLKPEVFSYNSKDTPVSQFISRIKHLARTYDERDILENLGLGMLLKPDSDGARWYEGLPDSTKVFLSTNLEAWYHGLDDRFREDRGAVLRKADALTHSFDKEGTLSLQAYMDERVRLYNEAGDCDEDALVRRLVQGFDPVLRAHVELYRKTGNTLTDLRAQVAAKEHAARDSWRREKSAQDDINRRLTAMERSQQPLRDRSTFQNRGNRWASEQALNVTSDLARAARDAVKERRDKEVKTEMKTDDASKDRPDNASWRRPWQKTDRKPWQSNNWRNADAPKTVKAFPVDGKVLVQDPDSEDVVEVPEDVMQQLSELHPTYDELDDKGDDDRSVTLEENA